MTTDRAGASRRRAAHRIAAATLCLCAVGSVPDAARSQERASPTAPIQRLDAALLTAMKAGQATSFAQRVAVLAPVVEQTFDLDAVLGLVVGPTWVTLPYAEKAKLAAAFQDYTVATYAANFNSYNGQRFQLSPNVSPVGNGEVIVDTNLVRADRSKVQLDYVMRHVSDGWKAVDVMTGGISRVAVQHSDFSSLLSSGGASALTAALKQKAATLSHGALA